jgi:hypothetical protein
VLRGDVESSAILFRWVRASVAELQLEADAVGPMVTLAGSTTDSPPSPGAPRPMPWRQVCTPGPHSPSGWRVSGYASRGSAWAGRAGACERLPATRTRARISWLLVPRPAHDDYAPAPASRAEIRSVADLTRPRSR